MPKCKPETARGVKIKVTVPQQLARAAEPLEGAEGEGLPVGLQEGGEVGEVGREGAVGHHDLGLDDAGKEANLTFIFDKLRSDHRGELKTFKFDQGRNAELALVVQNATQNNYTKYGTVNESANVLFTRRSWLTATLNF